MTNEAYDALVGDGARSTARMDDLITLIIEDAVAAERERCAKIAEDAAYVYEGRRIDGYSKGQYMMINGEKTVALIAARIREGQ